MGGVLSLRSRARGDSLSSSLLGAADSKGGAAHEQHMFGFWVAVSFTVNYVIGAGLLGLPEAFYKAGLVLSAVVILVFAYLLNITKDWMVETGARAEALFKAGKIATRRLVPDTAGRDVTLAVGDEHSAPAAASGEGASLLGGQGAAAAAELDAAPAREDYLIDSARKFEVTDLFAMFIGPKSPVVYAFIISLYLYGSLWAYTAVFAKSFAENVPTGIGGSSACDINSPCEWPMRVWMLLFALIVVPLTCRDLKEQVIVQVIMFLARILVVLLLCATVLGSHACNDGVVFAEVAPGTSRASDVPLADGGGLSTIIPVGIFAFIFHHSTPVLAQPIKNKYSVNRVFGAALLICCLAYCAMGLVVGSYFGPLVQSQCNLNWRNYVGCLPAPPGYSASGAAGNGTCTSPATWVTREGGPSPLCIDVADRPIYATIIRYIVVLFPALDVLSAFPLNAITLGNNLMSAVLGESAVLAPTADEETLAGHIERALATENHTTAQAAAQARGCCSGRCRGREVGVPGSGGVLSFVMSFLVKPAKTVVPLDAPLPAALVGTTVTAPSPALGATAAAPSALDVSRLSLDSVSRSAFASARGSLSSASAGSSPLSAGAGGAEEEGAGIGLIQLPAAAAARLAATAVASPAAAAAEAEAAAGLLEAPAALAILAKPWYVRTRRGHALTKTFYRLVAAVPPIVGALFVSNLGNILQVTGLVGVAIAFTIPASLRLASFAKTRAVFTFLSRLGPDGVGTRASASGAPSKTASAAPCGLPSVAGLEAHCPATLPPLGPALSGAPADTSDAAEAVVSQYADYAAKATAPSWKEMLMKVPGAEATLRTPYTSVFWVRGRLVEAFFVASLAMTGYVLFDIVQAIASG